LGAVKNALAEEKGGDSLSSKPDAVEDTKPAEILVVEDVELNQMLVKTLLEKDGHRVTVVGDGMEALRAFSEKRFDLVFMDIQMPNMDGITATRVIRACEMGEDALGGISGLEGVSLQVLCSRLKGTHTPIVAMTAHAFTEDKETCLKVGMDGYISKPIDLAKVRRATGKALGIRIREVVSTRIEPLNQEKMDHVLLDSVDVSGVVRYLSESYGISGEEIDKLLTVAKDSLEKNLNNARESIGRMDYDAIRVVAHTLKGSLSNLGLSELSQRCWEIQKKAESRDSQYDYQKAFAVIEEVLSPLLNF